MRTVRNRLSLSDLGRPERASLPGALAPRDPQSAESFPRSTLGGAGSGQTPSSALLPHPPARPDSRESATGYKSSAPGRPRASSSCLVFRSLVSQASALELVSRARPRGLEARSCSAPELRRRTFCCSSRLPALAWGVVRRPGRGQFRRAEGAGTRLNPEASVDSSLLLAQLGPWGAGGGVGGGGLSLVASLAGRGGSGSFYHACILTYGRGTQRGVMG